MSYTVTIYSEREKAEYRQKHFVPLDSAVHFSEEEHKTGPFGGAYVKHPQLHGLRRAPSNIQSAKEWFECCLWVVQNVRRFKGDEDTGKRGMSEEEFQSFFVYLSAKGCRMPTMGKSSASLIADYNLRKRICEAMGWSKSARHWTERRDEMKDIQAKKRATLSR